MPVTVVRPSTRDQYGDRTDEADEHELPGAVTAPRTSRDANGRRDGAVVGLTLYVQDPDADLLRTDLVRVDGELYEIEGEIGVYRSPYGSAIDGIEVALRRGQG